MEIKKGMKKLLPLLILFLMLLASCSLDSFMDAMSGNSFAGNNNANADYVSSTVDSMEKVSTDSAFVADDSSTIDFSELTGFDSIAKAFGSAGDLKVDLGDYADEVRKYGLLSPQEDPTNLYNSLSGALGSTSGIASLSAQLADSAPEDQSNAAKGSIALVLALTDQINKEENNLDSSISEMLKDLNNELTSKVKPEETLSKAEVLQVQIITNTVVSIAHAAAVLENLDQDNILENPDVSDAIDGLTLLSSLQNNLDSDVSMINVPDVSDIISTVLGTGSSSGEGATV